ncbi:PREDICTED: uncharacterized protein LOC101386880 [Odobenus rosmarus divergens]|uniref:Uncharacterized protein LOC101386880 n=1 Tax=Odobenus rosmarus divergens TaxID=9708 RepID=A0A9B0LRZ6_ODORO
MGSRRWPAAVSTSAPASSLSRRAGGRRGCADRAGPSQLSIFSLLLGAAQCPIIHSHLTCSPVSCLPRLSKPHHACHALRPYPLQSAQAPMGSLPKRLAELSPVSPLPQHSQAHHAFLLLLPKVNSSTPFRLPHDRAAPEFPPRSHPCPPTDSPSDIVQRSITQGNFSRITVTLLETRSCRLCCSLPTQPPGTWTLPPQDNHCLFIANPTTPPPPRSGASLKHQNCVSASALKTVHPFLFASSPASPAVPSRRCHWHLSV